MQPDGFMTEITDGGEFTEMTEWFSTRPSLKMLLYVAGTDVSVIATAVTLSDFKHELDVLKPGDQTGYRLCDVVLTKVNTKRKPFYLACAADVQVGDGDGRSRTCLKQLVKGVCPLHETSDAVPQLKVRAEFKGVSGTLFWFGLFGKVDAMGIGFRTCFNSPLCW